MSEHYPGIRVKAQPEPRVRLRVIPRIPPLEVEMQNTGTVVQWRVGTTGPWQDLITIDSINASVSVGDVVTLPPGSPATVENVGTEQDVVLDFGIPEGIQGDAATIAVGDVTAVAYGLPPTVTNSGTSSAAVFDFEIPDGEQGPAATIAVGTVTTVAPGQPATVTNAGTVYDAVFNFEIPEGAAGTIVSVVAGSGINVDATDPGNPVVEVETNLQTWNGIAPSANAQAMAAAANYAAMRALLDLEAGTDYYSKTAADAAFQPLDSDLTAIAALTTTSYGRAFLALVNQAGLMALLSAGSTSAAGILELATAAEYAAGSDTARAIGVAEAWNAADCAVLTDGATIAVDLAAGFNFGGASNAALALGGNQSLGAPSNVDKNQTGILWFTASGSTRTLTLNAAWILVDGAEIGPYSITTSQVLGVAYAVRGTTPYVTGIIRK